MCKKQQVVNVGQTFTTKHSETTDTKMSGGQCRSSATLRQQALTESPPPEVSSNAPPFQAQQCRSMQHTKDKGSAVGGYTYCKVITATTRVCALVVTLATTHTQAGAEGRVSGPERKKAKAQERKAPDGKRCNTMWSGRSASKQAK